MLKLLFVLEIGFVPFGVIASYEYTHPELYIYDGSYYAEMGATASIAFVYLGGMMRTETWMPKTGMTMHPHTMLYEIYGGLAFDHIDIGGRYYCRHPVIPGFFVLPIVPQNELGYAEIFLRLELSN